MNGMRILVVDDNEIVLSSIKTALSPLEWPVTTVMDSRIALDHIKTGSYDIVITDLQMPELDGIELLRERSP